MRNARELVEVDSDRLEEVLRRAEQWVLSLAVRSSRPDDPLSGWRLAPKIAALFAPPSSRYGSWSTWRNPSYDLIVMIT
jgi:hypothetical protein